MFTRTIVTAIAIASALLATTAVAPAFAGSLGSNLSSGAAAAPGTSQFAALPPPEGPQAATVEVPAAEAAVEYVSALGSARVDIANLVDPATRAAALSQTGASAPDLNGPWTAKATQALVAARAMVARYATTHPEEVQITDSIRVKLGLALLALSVTPDWAPPPAPAAKK